MKEDANLAISDGDRLSSGDELDDMCKYLQSEFVLDAFFSVSGDKLFNSDSQVREGISCEVGELKSWISNDGASRHMTSSQDLMTNYHECSGMVSTAGGDVLPIKGVGDILLRFLSDSVAFGIQLFNVAFGPQLNHNLFCHYSSLQPPTIRISIRKMVNNYGSSHIKLCELQRSAGRLCCVGTVWPEMLTKLFELHSSSLG